MRAERVESTPRRRSPSAAQPTAGQQLAASLRELAGVTLDRVAELALDKVEQGAQHLERIAADGGPKVGALVGGMQAKLVGGNVIWGALKGAYQSLSPAARIGLLVLLVLGILLLPVTLVLLLVAMVVVALVLIAQSRSTG